MLNAAERLTIITGVRYLKANADDTILCEAQTNLAAGKTARYDKICGCAIDRTGKE